MTTLYSMTGEVLFVSSYPYIGYTLEKAVQAFTDLTGLDLSGRYTNVTNFHQLKLMNAIVGYSDLSNLTFEQCNLRYANFSGANLYGTKFINCDLSHSNMSNAEFNGCYLEACDITGMIGWGLGGGGSSPQDRKELLRILKEEGYLT